MLHYPISERVSSPVPPHAFLGVVLLLFAVSAAATIACCVSMTTMAAMAMPGGWSMSMTWMRMPGQSWADAALTFLGMWMVMMVAMMLPALTLQLWRYRAALGSINKTRLNWLTVLVGLGYFAVWSAFGLAVFPIGVALATVAMQWPELARAVPLMIGAIVALAGALQFTAWKAHHLACCRAQPTHIHALSVEASTALRYGMRLGIHCSYCCAGLSAILLVVGVMDLRAMAVIAAAINVERLAPAGKRVARAIGAVTIAAGLFLIVRATWFG